MTSDNPSSFDNENPKMSALLFAGQGAQRVGMGRSLYEGSESARKLYEQADATLGWELTRISFEGPEEELIQTRVCQPALFVHGYVLFRLLEDSGALPDVRFALGLSLGEITALTAAGAFDFEGGLRVVAERGRLMQMVCESTAGAMASIIGEERETVRELCREFDIDMANLNCPGQIVVSGDKERVARAIEAGKERGMNRVIPLNVAGAYHSRLMAPAADAFRAFLGGVEIRPPRLTILSNTTAGPVNTPDEIREALGNQVVSPVFWEDSLREAAVRGAGRFLELGPGGVLAGLVRRTDREWSVESFSEFADLPA